MYIEPIRQDTNLDWLPDVITLMINGIGECFIDGHIGIDEEPIGMCRI